MARSRNGEAISARRCTAAARRKLAGFVRRAREASDHKAWRRGKAVQSYIDGIPVIEIARILDVTRGSVNRWLQWYEATGLEGLKTKPLPGPTPRMCAAEKSELIEIIEAGPLQNGFSSGVWTGPMIGDLIARRFGVRYHPHYVPELLHELGFSVQRPRKRLARADTEKQDHWIKKRFPAIKKRRDGVEVLCSSKTKPASGSTARSTRPGLASARSRA